jgi:D-alanyl-D-alanine dipeptidase
MVRPAVPAGSVPGMQRALLAAATAAIALVACSSPAFADDRGVLRVRQVSEGLYIEGAVSYLQLRRHGRVVLRRSYRPGRRVALRRRLRAGRYRLRSWQRPCDGNCGTLDPPTDACSRRMFVPAGGSVRAVVRLRPGRGCSIRNHVSPALFPPAPRIRAVRRYLSGRGGLNSFALIDSWGRVRGFARDRVYITASVVKAMLLVSYLRSIGNRMPDASERAALGPMITVSDNGRATSIYRRVGDAALIRLARRAGMRTFGVSGFWGNATFSALDQARFFRVFDRLTPPRSRGYARRLLSSIVPWQRWGFSRYSLAAGFRTYFKGGWRGTSSGRLVHEAALFVRGGQRVSMAVLTDGNPSHDHGAETLRGVAARIFGARARRSQEEDEPAGNRATRRAGLVDLRALAPGLELDIRYATRRNITGRRLPGYCRPWALMRRAAGRDLARVQRRLARRGLGLLVLDAYRPARASRALVRWAERSGNGHLVGTYIARRSRHNLGTAVDLTLVRRRDGKRLEMGTGYDDLSERAHTRNATGRALRNRLTLLDAMERFGFENYDREWWHYEHRSGGSAYLDVPLGCGRG